MKKAILMLVAGLMTFSMSLAMADDAKQPSAKQQAQRQRMTDCSKDAKAKGLKGDDRKTYMKSCLKGEADTAGASAMSDAKSAKTTQQEKMKSCNADAKTKGLKGADRKTFMKTCLSGSASAN